MFLTQIEKAAGNLKNLPIWDFYCFWKCSWPIEEGGITWWIGYLMITMAQVSHQTAIERNVYTIPTKILLHSG